MKRLHIHVGVNDLSQSIQFYNTLFGEAPSKTKDDYAKWMLDDPRINFAISTKVGKVGVDHLGIQAGTEQELSKLRERLASADMALFDEGETNCCYAQSDKSWVADPNGLAWEAYRNMDDVQLFSVDANSGDLKSSEKSQGACCLPS